MAEQPRRPDVDVLADYVEGLLDADARAQVERQIAEDPAVAELVAELEALPDLLAATPMEPMPADVVARVDAALAREAQDRAAAPAAGHVTALPRRRRWLAPALAAAVTVGVVAIAAPVVLDTGGSSVDSAGEAGSTQDGAASDEEEPGAFAAPESAPGDSGSTPETGGQVGDPPRLTSDEFASQVAGLYADARPATQEEIAEYTARSDRLTLPAEQLVADVRVAPLCYGDVESTFRTDIVFDGEPAYLLVYENPVRGGPEQALAFRCSGDRARILDQEPIDLP